MMKIKDFLCLLAGVALLALAFQVKGFAEETGPVFVNQANVYESVQADEEMHQLACCD